jgi:thiol-disulfide isomerase/thioredoxin
MEDIARVLSTGMSSGLVALVAALVVATALGLAWRWRTGRFRAAPSIVAPAAATREAALRPDLLTEADLGTRLGRQATLVQFSTAFCAPCRPTRQILAEVAGMVDGVTHVEIDAADRLDLVRRLRINSTPTVLVLGPDGAIVKRAAGLPRRADVIAAVGTAIDPAAPVPAGGE